MKVSISKRPGAAIATAEAATTIAGPVAVIPLRLLEKRMTELVTINDLVTHSECLA